MALHSEEPRGALICLLDSSLSVNQEIGDRRPVEKLVVPVALSLRRLSCLLRIVACPHQIFVLQLELYLVDTKLFDEPFGGKTLSCVVLTTPAIVLNGPFAVRSVARVRHRSMVLPPRPRCQRGESEP